MLHDAVAHLDLVAGQIEERHTAGGERIRHHGDHRIPELAFQVGDMIDVAGAADLLVKGLGVGDVIGVDAVAAHANRAKLPIAESNGRGGSPALIGLHARGEEVDVRLEWGLECLVPIHDVGQDRQGVRAQSVEAGSHDVGHAAFVHKKGYLRFADRQLAAILDLTILHGITVGQDAVLGLGPVDDVDELLGKKVTKAHIKGSLELYASGKGFVRRGWLALAAGAVAESAVASANGRTAREANSLCKRGWK